MQIILGICDGQPCLLTKRGERITNVRDFEVSLNTFQGLTTITATFVVEEKAHKTWEG